jgi:hypothetical protein
MFNKSKREPIYIVAIVILIITVFWVINRQRLENEAANAQFLVESKKVISQDLSDINFQLEQIKKNKDTAFSNKAESLKQEIESIKRELDGNTSDEQQIKLKNRLTQLQNQIQSLNSEYQNYQQSIVTNMIDVIEVKDKQLDEVYQKFINTKAELSELKKELGKLNEKKIVSSIHFTVIAYNKKNYETKKSRYTSYLQLNLKVNGADSLLAFNDIYLQVIDPLGKNIARPGEKLSLKDPNAYPSYKFMPPEGQSFRSGVYRVRLFEEANKFELIHTISLNSKL